MSRANKASTHDVDRNPSTQHANAESNKATTAHTTHSTQLRHSASTSSGPAVCVQHRHGGAIAVRSDHSTRRHDSKLKPTSSSSVRHSSSHLESRDFTWHASDVFEAYARAHTPRDYKRTSAMRWILTLIIGVLTALIAYGIVRGTTALTAVKFNYIRHLISKERVGDLAAG